MRKESKLKRKSVEQWGGVLSAKNVSNNHFPERGNIVTMSKGRFYRV